MRGLFRRLSPYALILVAAVSGGIILLAVKGEPLLILPGLAGLIAAWFGWRRFERGLLNGAWSSMESPARGPKIVAIGGGTGLSTILRGLKNITANLTAIVTVADDGGSSGRLRHEFGILPPGDIRNCLIALADLEPLMERLMQHRFTTGQGLAGHNFGNLFLTAMTSITGDFDSAIRASSKVLAVRGQVLPATLEDVSLWAEMADGSKVEGESNLREQGIGIKRLHMAPPDCHPVPDALVAIAEADAIILGPGSLYTSIIPNLLVKELREAIRRSTALKVFICNAMTEPGETTGYTAADHIEALIEHAGKGLVDVALVNNQTIPQESLIAYANEGAAPVKADLERISALEIAPLTDSLIGQSGVIRHDPTKLNRILLGLLKTKKLPNHSEARWRRRFHRTLRELVPHD